VGIKVNSKESFFQKTLKLTDSIRNRHFFLIDVFIFICTPILSLFLKRGRAVDLFEIQVELTVIILLFTTFKIFILRIGGIYRQMWTHAGIPELAKVGILGILITFGEVILINALTVLYPQYHRIYPQSLAVIDGILSLFFVGGIRFSIRVTEHFSRKYEGFRSGINVLIVGAGDAGVMITNEMRANPQLGLHPVGFVDDNEKKKGLQIRGVQVLGNRSDIPKIVKEYNVDQIIIAMPAVSGKVIREIDAICKTTNIRTRIIPGVFELLDDTVRINKIRDIAIDDLLRREPVKIDDDSIRSLMKGKRILVTGAGGSIGGELCRQVARYNPTQLVLLGHGENSIFSISNELARKHPDMHHPTIIADIRDKERLSNVFKRFKPELVFHAAAHKHVPLMELNPSEAVTNNIIGTHNIVDLSIEYDIERFLLISTDKAVNPTNVMGATKRVAELIVQEAAHRTNKPFVAVRFGNVLGSRGSVIPTFREQIDAGGPVTITHPDVKRYFMTIPEAVQLVLQAGTNGNSGDIYVLDMGEPVKIVDLAYDLIRLSGLEPIKDIDISFTGLRAGEKLFEELVLDDEHFERTTHEKIFVLKNGKHQTEDTKKFLKESIDHLRRYAISGNAEEIRIALKRIVPEFQYQIPSVPL
jgi:FlaA1/EpsC-like NDP-sugar epimerase